MSLRKGGVEIFAAGREAGGLMLGPCWAHFCCYLQCFGHPDPKMKNAKVASIEAQVGLMLEA